MSRRVSVAAFARETKLSRRQVGRLIADGVLERGDDGLLDLAAGKRALAAQRKRREADGDAVADAGAELRRLKAELVRYQGEWRRATAELRKLELAVKRGECVELAEVRADGAKAASVMQSVLRSIPQRTALALACACRGAAVVEHAIAGEVERAIGSMADASIFVGPFNGKSLHVVCGHCAERARQDAAEAKRRAELEADGVADSWQETLRAALERCLEDRPRAGDEIDVDALPHELREGLGSAALFLRAVARVADRERLELELARGRNR